MAIVQAKLVAAIQMALDFSETLIKTTRKLIETFLYLIRSKQNFAKFHLITITVISENFIDIVQMDRSAPIQKCII
jgi:membrane protein CcdC involved in cytochrome C biogenesis